MLSAAPPLFSTVIVTVFEVFTFTELKSKLPRELGSERDPADTDMLGLLMVSNIGTRVPHPERRAAEILPRKRREKATQRVFVALVLTGFIGPPVIMVGAYGDTKCIISPICIKKYTFIPHV
jgi:hypothetical protein